MSLEGSFIMLSTLTRMYIQLSIAWISLPGYFSLLKYVGENHQYYLLVPPVLSLSMHLTPHRSKF